MVEPKTDCIVNLIGEDGNAFSIIGKVSSALRRAGYSDLAEEFQVEAMKGDYDHVLQKTREYVSVE